jgi:hypothetical protein
MSRHSVRPGFPAFQIGADIRGHEPKHAQKQDKRRRRQVKELVKAKEAA